MDKEVRLVGPLGLHGYQLESRQWWKKSKSLSHQWEDRIRFFQNSWIISHCFIVGNARVDGIPLSTYPNVSDVLRIRIGGTWWAACFFVLLVFVLPDVESKDYHEYCHNCIDGHILHAWKPPRWNVGFHWFLLVQDWQGTSPRSSGHKSLGWWRRPQ